MRPLNFLRIVKLYSGVLRLNVDPEKIKQVFWNIGLNTLDAMPMGGRLVISTERSNGFIHIRFKDSVIGIQEKDIEKNNFTTKEHGTGLGLAIAYRIIDEHKGRIKVESSVGLGTNFEIILTDVDEKAKR